MLSLEANPSFPRYKALQSRLVHWRSLTWEKTGGTLQKHLHQQPNTATGSPKLFKPLEGLLLQLWPRALCHQHLPSPCPGVFRSHHGSGTISCSLKGCPLCPSGKLTLPAAQITVMSMLASWLKKKKTFQTQLKPQWYQQNSILRSKAPSPWKLQGMQSLKKGLPVSLAGKTPARLIFPPNFSRRKFSLQQGKASL